MRTASILLTAAACCAAFVGCTAIPTVAMPDMQWVKELSGNDEGPPEQLIAMWTDASMKKAGTSGSTRGFGGRIYFYDAKRHSVMAEGELVVYAFVEKDRQAPSKLPERKFVFTKEELEQNYTKTALGHCYDVWLPWGQDDGKTVSVSLLPTLKSPEGKVVMGSQSLNVLGGKDDKSGVDKADVAGGVRQVSYDQDAEPGQGESSRRRMSIYDPQTNITLGPTADPVGRLPGPTPGVKQVGFQSELPQATGVATTTFELPKPMALAMKKAPPTASARNTLTKRYEAWQQVEQQKTAEAGVKFDLTRAASLDSRGNADSTADASAQSAADSLARTIAANAALSGAPRVVPTRTSAPSFEKSVSRFNSEPPRTPAWTRNQAKWRQED